MSYTVTERSEIWNSILAAIKRKIDSDNVYDSFFSNTSISDIQGNTMIIRCSSTLARSLFETRFLPVISEAVYGCTQTNYSLRFIEKDNQTLQEEKKGPAFFKSARLDPRYTFDSFVVGASDIEARQAATLIAANPGETFNPLLIYGDSGLGKTHLLEAIGNAIEEDHPERQVLYVSSADFIDEYVNYATGHQTEASFTQFFRDKVDVLLLDDVQYLRGKSKTMECFFNVFQILVNAKKQIVLTSDQDPRLLDGLDERLKTRFSQGLAVKIQKPDIETSRAILRAKIATGDLSSNQVDDDVIDLLASTFSDNIRELEGALNRLIFYKINHAPAKRITIDIAKEAISSLSEAKSELAKPSANRIISVVADYYSLTPAQLTGKLRLAQIVTARHISMYLCKEILGMNYSEIGKTFGRDHSSVMSALEKVENMGKSDAATTEALSALRRKLIR